MTDPAEIAKGLTEAQRRALVHAAFLLDAAAGEGLGVEAEMMDGTWVVVFADDTVTALCQAFGLTLTDRPAAFGLSVRAVLQEKG